MADRVRRRWWGLGLAGILALGAAAVLALGVPDAVLPALGIGRPVRLYFASADAMYLVPEVRYVLPGQDGVLERLELLSRGPRDRRAHFPVIPAGARPLSVRLDGDVATVDFSRELVERHWGGSAGELMTVYGIVHTVAEVPGIRRVRITIEGERILTLAGHVDLSEPVAPDPSLVRPEQPSPADTAARRRS